MDRFSYCYSCVFVGVLSAFVAYIIAAEFGVLCVFVVFFFLFFVMFGWLGFLCVLLTELLS